MRRLLTSILFVSLLAICVNAVLAQGQPAVIRIDPCLPTMLSSPATFSVYTEAFTAYNPIILLVMTDVSYQGLTGDVLVEWDGGHTSFSSFTVVTSAIPPGAPPGTLYQLATLKSEIGVDDTLYYAYGPFLSNPIDSNPQTFKVTLPSTNPRMLVYVLGSSSSTSSDLNMRVPPSIPGFVVPDLATIMLAMASFSAYALYALKRRKP